MALVDLRQGAVVLHQGLELGYHGRSVLLTQVGVEDVHQHRRDGPEGPPAGDGAHGYCAQRD